MTSRLPKMAAMMIKIMIEAVKTVIKILIHSWSIISSVLVLLRLLLIVALEYEPATSVTNSFIVRICSLLNDEEDDNFGDNVWDDMSVSDLNFPSFCLLLHFRFPSDSFRSAYVATESMRNDAKQIKSQQLFRALWCKNKAFMFCWRR